MGAIIGFILGGASVLLIQKYKKFVEAKNRKFSFGHWIFSFAIVLYSAFLVTWFYMGVAEKQVKAGIAGLVLFGIIGVVFLVVGRLLVDKISTRKSINAVGKEQA